MFQILLTIYTSLIIASNRTVLVDDNWPEEVAVSYSCSYQKGQVRKGDVAELVMSGWQGYELEGVSVCLRSNKTGGAGRLELKVDGQSCWQVEGDYASLFGAYSADYKRIGKAFETPIVLNGSTLVLRLEGTENSLYWDSIQLAYRPQVARPRTVCFSAAELVAPMCETETATGAGVVLPTMADRPDWTFVGWTDTPYHWVEKPASVWAAGSRYYPTADGTLYALWTDEKTEILSPCPVVPEDGYYALAWPSLAYGLRGGLVGELMAVVPWQINNEECHNQQIGPQDVYAIEWVTDSTLLLRHAATGAPIGYADGELAQVASEWTVYRLEDGSMAIGYDRQNGPVTILNIGWRAETGSLGAALSTYSKSALRGEMMRCYEAHDPHTIAIWSTHPEGEGWQHIGAPDRPTRSIRIGVWTLQTDGVKKRLSW